MSGEVFGDRQETLPVVEPVCVSALLSGMQRAGIRVGGSVLPRLF
jgi:hypothetical protein